MSVEKYDEAGLTRRTMRATSDKMVEIRIQTVWCQNCSPVALILWWSSSTFTPK